MSEIKDTGKVWMKGSVGTAHAVRVDDKVFATGQKEGQSVDLWLDNEGLCIDLHDSKIGERTARFIPLNTPATLKGTLFNGFEKTKHADVLIVPANSDEIKKKSVSGKKYLEGDFKVLDRLTFWQTIWKN
ncbi:MAG: hypothetical protein ACI8PD_001304 [Nitrospinales bacterium]|jgi:hypothetical protein